MPRKIYRKDTSYITDMINNANSILQTATSIYTREKQLSEAAYKSQANIYSKGWESKVSGEDGILKEMLKSPNYGTYQEVGNAEFEAYWTVDNLVSGYGGTESMAERFLSENKETMRQAFNVQIESAINAQMKRTLLADTLAQGGNIALEVAVYQAENNIINGQQGMSDILSKYEANYNNHAASVDRTGLCAPSSTTVQEALFTEYIEQSYKELAERNMSSPEFSRSRFQSEIETIIDDAGKALDLSSPSALAKFKENRETLIAKALSFYDGEEENVVLNSESKRTNAMSDFYDLVASGEDVTPDLVFSVIRNSGLDYSSKQDALNIQAIFKEAGIVEDNQITSRVAEIIGREDFSTYTDADRGYTTISGVLGSLDTSSIPQDATPAEKESWIRYHATKAQSPYVVTTQYGPKLKALIEENGLTSDDEIYALAKQFSLKESQWIKDEGTVSSSGSVSIGGKNIPENLTPEETTYLSMHLDPFYPEDLENRYAVAGNINGTIRPEVAYAIKGISKKDVATPVLDSNKKMIENYIATFDDDGIEAQLTNLFNSPRAYQEIINTMGQNNGLFSTEQVQTMVNKYAGILAEDNLRRDLNNISYELYKDIGLEGTVLSEPYYGDNTAYELYQAYRQNEFDLLINTSTIRDIRAEYNERLKTTSRHNIMTFGEMRDITADHVYGMSWRSLNDSQKNICSVYQTIAMTEEGYMASAMEIFGDDIYEIDTDLGIGAMNKNGDVLIPLDGGFNFAIIHIGKDNQTYKDLVHNRTQSSRLRTSNFRIENYNSSIENFNISDEVTLYENSRNTVGTGYGRMERRPVKRDTTYLDAILRSLRKSNLVTDYRGRYGIYN